MWLGNHNAIKQHNIPFDCKQADQTGNDHAHHDCEEFHLYYISSIILFNNLKLHTNSQDKLKKLQLNYHNSIIRTLEVKIDVYKN